MMINRQNSVRISIAPLKLFLLEVCRVLRVPPESVTVCLVTNPMIARWNSQYRAKKTPTDVLSFPATGPAKNPGHPRRMADRRTIRAFDKPRRPRRAAFREDGAYLGDLAIAPAVARRNARQFGRTLDREIKILILHGMLHLLGYDHEADHGQMERRERRLRRLLGLN
jgi:probable rRNA maturation factor